MLETYNLLWANKEFGSAQLGDARRTKRLVEIASGLVSNVGQAISMSCGKVAAQLVSRFFSREEVTVSSVLESHTKETCMRSIAYERVFAVQDTTHLNYASHLALEGLGPIGKVEKGRGLLMHTVLAVTPDKTPLGILGIDIWARPLDEHGKAKKRKTRPIEDKESHKWLTGLSKAESGVDENQALLVIGDRESDIYELFAAKRREKTDVLVRASQNRALVCPDDMEYRLLYDAVEHSVELGRYDLNVPRRGDHPARTAHMSVRAVAVTIRNCRKRESEGVRIYCVWAVEVDAPDGVEPLDWLLLTSLVVNDFDSALYVINAYTCRWVIEEFHRVLKSGCKVERLQFERLDSMYPAIAVLSVVAWRVLYLTKESRNNPDGDASLVSTRMERNVLEKWLKSRREKSWRIITVNDFVRAVAILGGFMARKCDGNPGPKSLWQGLRRLEDMVMGYQLFTDTGMLEGKS